MSLKSSTATVVVTPNYRVKRIDACVDHVSCRRRVLGRHVISVTSSATTCEFISFNRFTAAVKGCNVQMALWYTCKRQISLISLRVRTQKNAINIS